jgi:hypothetical protein
MFNLFMNKLARRRGGRFSLAQILLRLPGGCFIRHGDLLNAADFSFRSRALSSPDLKAIPWLSQASFFA